MKAYEELFALVERLKNADAPSNAPTVVCSFASSQPNLPFSTSTSKSIQSFNPISTWSLSGMK